MGDGKNVQIPQCPREKLEKDQVRYLTRDERRDYLVTVDERGAFQLVWTSTARFKDSLQGIVGIEEDVPQFSGNSTTLQPESTSNPPSCSSSSCSSSSTTESLNSVLSDQDPKPFTDEEYKAAKLMKKVVHANPAVAFKRLLGKSSKKEDTWLFVADTSFRLYIGIKKSGAFQHSSFLRGARIAAAGIIKFENGQVRSLAPLSGHYRPPAANFRAFHHALQQQGVDMSHVSMSKSYIMLAGIQGYSKTKRKMHAIHERFEKSKTNLHTSEE
ncbi:hypothetical protein N7457_005238 [Penicillium paradoxum]|uniref:uncharacterized protein n=1 Tax=Penicillium paradoxum TaxID=176176 RepID=UPI002546FFD9|nr:uncharacterized protein N7457_005238 [Penicillium paradoxum]KAJ5780078.1 hypothetical protein N7457_005238 [Penicillium paradoxum]